jgi:hypothetical protein
MTTTLDDLKQINDVIKDIADFVRSDDDIKPDFEEYIRTIGSDDADVVFNYIFERQLNNKTILEMYAAKHDNDIVQALMNSMSSVFEVKRKTQNGFELYNIINEKTYTLTSLVKMTSFRTIGSGQYVVARIFAYDSEHYLFEISGILPITRKDEALRYAVAKIVQNPELTYLDNPEKLEELEKNVAELYDKFIEYFGADEVITTNKFADEVINQYNSFVETGVREPFEDKIQTPETYRFFDVSELSNSYDNFLENSLGGFASHSEVYDVGIIFDKELGLYAVPFYATFNKVFEGDVDGSQECILFFLNNEKVTANLLRRVAAKHKNFMDVINKTPGAGEGLKLTLDELLRWYKPQYMKHKIFSPTTVLYKSRAFSNVLGIIEEDEQRPEIDTSNVGRNEPCPCGSGKKFKKCCAV